MAKVNLEKMSMEELKELQSNVDTAIAEFEDRRRASAMAEMEEVARKHGYSTNDLIGGSSKRGKSSAKAKAAPKYRNPDDASQTWSGRGRQPAWFKEAVDSGKSPDKMKI